MTVNIYVIESLKIDFNLCEDENKSPAYRKYDTYKVNGQLDGKEQMIYFQHSNLITFDDIITQCKLELESLFSVRPFQLLDNLERPEFKVVYKTIHNEANIL